MKLTKTKEMIDVSAENIARVGYVFGILEASGKLDVYKLNFSNNDELFDEWKQIYEDWKNYVDIKDENEEGYIVAYAERVLLERYGLKSLSKN
jgi:hypothetical protein